jgi:MarR family transcriptional regulator, organic hydroperoxide resistance regulator
VADRLPQLELDNQLCFALYRASRAVVRAYGPLLADLGLTYPQYMTMLVLWQADEPLPVSRIGERLALDSGTLTPLLKRLEDQGLVGRRRDPDDERRVLVSLTPEGTAMRSAAAGIPAAIFPRYGLTLGDARQLLHDVTGLAEALERG